MSSLPLFRNFERIVFFTGAGMSAESGVPTYRGAGGIWKEYNYEDYACQRAFNRDPEKVWDFHDKRREKVASCEPNDGHRLIAKIQREKPNTLVITQNIDGLHQRAGATDVVELHGSLWRVRCSKEGTLREDFTAPIANRKCSCGAYLRPDIVWFEDPLNPKNIRLAEKAMDTCDLLVSIGTSAVVYPAAQLPLIATDRGAVTVELNPEDTPLSSSYQYRLRKGASEGLRMMAE